MAFSSYISFSKSLPFFFVALLIATCHCTQAYHLSLQRQQCIHEHFSALIEFKTSLRFSYRRRMGYYQSKSNLSSWNPGNRDCCTWEGITCDNASGHVTTLDLTQLSISGRVNFESLGRIRSLQSLDLAFNMFYPSPIPSAIGNLSSLIHLDLSRNWFFGRIPGEMSRLSRLVFLDMYGNGFNGNDSNLVPLELERIGALVQNMSRLRELNLGFVDVLAEGSEWSKVISSALPNLRRLSIYRCNLSGTIHPPWLKNLTHLKYLDLSANQISGTVPSWLFTLSSFRSLLLWGNQLGGQLSEFRYTSSSLLETIDLSENQLQGMIPSSFFKLRKLYLLNLYGNNFTGVLDVHILKNLQELVFLDLSYNALNGSLPIPPSSIITFLVSNNHLSGEISMSICNATFLKTFDISVNKVGGHIPECFGKMSNGFIKEDCSLETLDLSENYLEGKLPVALTNCKHLTTLNLGNNQIQDAFPWWVHGFADLRIFILSPNNFYGPIQLPPACQNFTKLQIVDLSLNRFNGSLTPSMFCGWKKTVGEPGLRPGYLKTWQDGDSYYYEQVMITSKRLKMHLKKITAANVIVDLSGNGFQGQIPESIGSVKSLWVLNMSDNGFVGQIPKSFKNLTTLESLDLSRNRLCGNIPVELLELTFLSVLDLSGNQLTGSIPHAKQFLTFTNESYQGNPGLCGPPLSKQCEDSNGAPTSGSNATELSSESEYSWKILAAGFALGYGAGAAAFCWTLVLWTEGRRAYNNLVYKMFLWIIPSAL